MEGLIHRAYPVEFILKKILHTGDTNSLDRYGKKQQYRKNQKNNFFVAEGFFLALSLIGSAEEVEVSRKCQGSTNS